MAKANKTTQTEASVEAYFAAIDDPTRRTDCEKLAAMMHKATGEPAKMWGPSIVGFGSYHYRYESRREGDMCRLGFSARKDAMALYGLDPEGNAAMLEKLGKHKTGKGCLYIRRLADVEAGVLEKLLKAGAGRHR
ncbi:MAG TPA: DUF1801 domain-containing protein [Xanthomonadaceae bacterium]|jgi:hypothetical protein|nr:DUF1801 domain-containing protein [Xanthomonadaceae bacterium]